LSQSIKQKNSASTNIHNLGNLKNINLPKLDRVNIKNNYKASYEEHKKPYYLDQKGLEGMLKIEGKSSQQSNVRYDYEYEQLKKNADREIKAELRKLYNLKPSPKKHIRRNHLELPKII
jgi:ATP-dependent Lon protease